MVNCIKSKVVRAAVNYKNSKADLIESTFNFYLLNTNQYGSIIKRWEHLLNDLYVLFWTFCVLIYSILLQKLLLKYILTFVTVIFRLCSLQEIRIGGRCEWFHSIRYDLLMTWPKFHSKIQTSFLINCTLAFLSF